MKKDKRIEWKVISRNGDATTSMEGIVQMPITVMEFVEQIVLRDERSWGYIRIGNQLSPSMIKFRQGKIIESNTVQYDSVKDLPIKKLFFNGGWSCEDFTITL